jgi:putative tricarboxylic transport membrane protein
MAVLVGGLLMHGLTPGPEMLTTSIDMTYLIIAAAVLGKIFAGVISFFVGTRLVFITKVRGSLMAPGIITIALVGSFAVAGHFADVVLALIFGLIGFYMKNFGYSIIALIIALVLGGLLESSYHQSMTTFGWGGFVSRPISIVLLVLTILSLAWPTISKTLKKRKGMTA